MFSSTRRFDPSVGRRVSTARERKKERKKNERFPVWIPVPFIERSADVFFLNLSRNVMDIEEGKPSFFFFFLFLSSIL